MSSNEYFIAPLQRNSQCISFPEWVSLFTLCLAPLIAHVASGAPPVSYLSPSRPKWHEHLCHYNPTSIIWRYAAITDRRIRATRWSQNDLAASNAIFWTAKGWDGGEDMVFTAAPHCSRCPELTRVRIFSVTMLKTIITTLQGLAALYSLIGTLAGFTTLHFVKRMGVDMLFLPLAILGLLRLCAATWLTEDFGYSPRDDGLNNMLLRRFPNLAISEHEIQLIDPSDTLDPFLVTPLPLGAHFRSPNSSYSSRIFRVFYLLVLGGVWGVSVAYTMPAGRGQQSRYTTTSFLVGLFYFVFLTISIVLYTFYFFFRSQTTTTLLPCISRIWYRVYTVLLMGFISVLIVIASIETNMTPTGLYSSEPPIVQLECRHLVNYLSFLPNSPFLGLASRVEVNKTWLEQNYSSIPVAGFSGHNALLEERYWLYNYTGYCVGRFEDTGR